jgi:hypothetical protein
MNKMKTFNLIKRIAKHGKQCVIVIPSILQEQLKAGDLVQLKIDIIPEEEDGI